MDVTSDITETFHAYGTVTDTKIDYIFTTRELAAKVIAAGKWDDVHAGCFLSDHYPVWVEVALEE